tara:strand:- start:6421 stop:7257 length:837 start_codon:yes stop_codon:yes gene_type:complete
MAIDSNKKFLYFNKDSTSGEMDESLCFPVSSFIGAETQTASIIDLYFKGSKSVDATQVRVTIDTGFINIKNFYKKLVDQINFGELAFIKVMDYAERHTHLSDVTFAMVDNIAPTFTLQDNILLADSITVTNDTVTDSLRATSRNIPVTHLYGSSAGSHEGDIIFLGSTSTTAGKLYHYKSDGTWEEADADSASTCDGLLAVALGLNSATHGMLLRGTVTLNHDPGALGDVLFVSTTAGEITATAPSGSGDIVRIVGYCLHATGGQIWFNPDGAFVEVA